MGNCYPISVCDKEKFLQKKPKKHNVDLDKNIVLEEEMETVAANWSIRLQSDFKIFSSSS